jgi:hypothetical protein
VGVLNAKAPFDALDLEELDALLLARADACVSLREVYAGNRYFRVIQMRHDVDDNPGALEAARKIAGWEAERGYRSTYYLLHTARYWGTKQWSDAVLEMARAGHEVGIHADALGWCVEHGGDPNALMRRAIADLRELGVPVTSVAGHGNKMCPEYGFANDEQFVECRRPRMGDPDRVIRGPHDVRIDPRPLREYGLSFEAVRLGRAYQLSDSGGQWAVDPFEVVAARFPDRLGQLHFLWHPDWWVRAL